MIFVISIDLFYLSMFLSVTKKAADVYYLNHKSY